MSQFINLIRRDLFLTLRQGSDAALILVFYLLCVLMFPFAVGPEPTTLARIGPGVLWVTALLATLLALDRLFAQDFEDGSLDQLALLPLPVPMLALAKVIANWLVTGLPLILAAIPLAETLSMDRRAYGVLIAAMALGTPTLNLIGALGAALVLGARRSSGLLALLVMPLYIPVLIFGVGAVDAAVLGLPALPYLSILGACLLAALVLCPWATAAALRQALA
jgi:heme exporter protein B